MASYFPAGWQHYLAGGLLIGTGVSLLFLLSGRIGGMSSVFTTTWSWFSRHPYFRSERFTSSRRWRLVYALGLVLGALAWWWIASPGESLATAVPTWQLLVGGVLVGFGARLGSGCTSGHGICGLASLQLPSLVAVLTFMATAMVVANLTLRVGGG